MNQNEIAYEQPAPAQQSDANALAAYSPYQYDASSQGAPIDMQYFAPKTVPADFPNPQIDFSGGDGAVAAAPLPPAEQLSPEQQAVQQQMETALEGFMTTVRDTYSDQISPEARQSPSPEEFSAQLDSVIATAQQAGALDAQSVGQIMGGAPTESADMPYAQPIPHAPAAGGLTAPGAAMPPQMAPVEEGEIPAGIASEPLPETATAEPQSLPVAEPQQAPSGMAEPTPAMSDPAAAAMGDPAAAAMGDPAAAAAMGDPAAAAAMGDPAAAAAMGDPAAAAAMGDPAAAGLAQPDTMQFAPPEATQSPENMPGQPPAATPEQTLETAKGQLLQFLESKRGQTMSKDDLFQFAQLLTLCVDASYNIGRNGGAAGETQPAQPVQPAIEPSTAA
jgi:hypothetical protein